jgi:hypothetical protein
MKHSNVIPQRKSEVTAYRFGHPARIALGTILCALALTQLISLEAHAQVNWPQFGQNDLNTANNNEEKAISPTTVVNLK